MRAAALAWVMILCGLTVGNAQDVLQTGITGTLSASGLESPLYVLSYSSIQQLMLDASTGPVSEARIEEALRDTPVHRDDLVRLGLLAPSASGYRINYLLLTTHDQQEIYRVTERFGADLAATFDASRPEFDELLAAYPNAALRDAVTFALIAGFVLNWEGLELTTELGLRVAPSLHENGDRYLVHSSEIGAELETTGMYWGSHSFPGRSATFTTFGDGPSQPRIGGIPDVFFGPADEGLARLRAAPEVYAAVRNHYVTYIGAALEDAGDIMMALSGGPRSRDELRAGTEMSAERFDATLGLLAGTGYITEQDGRYGPSVVVLGRADSALVVGSVTLGRSVTRSWLDANYAELERALTHLSPLAQGLPFDLVFSEVWHAVFGFATRQLVEVEFYIDPYGPASAFHGFVPVVWHPSLFPVDERAPRTDSSTGRPD